MGYLKTEIIENHGSTLEWPLLLRSMVFFLFPFLKENLLAAFSHPNLKEEILDVLAPFSIILGFTVCR